MAEPMIAAGGARADVRRRRWRIARWTIAVAVLLTPLVMMQVSEEWHWGPASFAVAGLAIGGLLLVYELAVAAGAGGAYRAGVAVALATGLGSVWATVVRDDGTGLPYLLVVVAAVVSAWTAGLRAAALARGMAGVATMQALTALAIATAPTTVAAPGGVAHSLGSGAGLAALWLGSAALFLIAGRRG